MARDGNDRLLYRWRDLVLSEHGPASHTTRHVLTVLSLRMDPDGGNCYPSTRRLATETGLSRRAVGEHLGRAEERGWIERSERGGGRGWKRHEYRPQIPDDVVTERNHLARNADRNPARGGDGGSPRISDGGYGESPPQARRGDFHASDVVTERNLSSSIESPDTTTVPGGTHPPDGEDHDPYGGKLPPPSNLIQTDGGHYVYPPVFEETWQAYPSRYGGNPKKGAYAAWRARAMNGADPKALLKAARHYAEYAEAEGQAGTEYVKQTSTFYGPEEPWRDYIEPMERPKGHDHPYQPLR